jgi:hypothetical protein
MNDITHTYNSLKNRFDQQNESYQSIKNRNFTNINEFKTVSKLYSTNYNESLSDLTKIIEFINNTDKKQGEVEEESPASIIRRKPNIFQDLNENHKRYLDLDESKRVVNNKTSGWCTLKILGSLEEGNEDTLELLIVDQGTGSDSSGFMIGLLSLNKPYTESYYSGQHLFSFSRGGTTYETGNFMKNNPGSIGGSFGTGDRVKFMVNPNDGRYEIYINNDLKISGEFYITEPVTFALGLYYFLNVFLS